VNEKTNLRYTGFRAADDGGRVFEFSVSATGQVTFLIAIEIPKAFFEGSNRMHLQDGVGVSYAKLKHLLTLETGRRHTATVVLYRHGPGPIQTGAGDSKESKGAREEGRREQQRMTSM
jgi:hypothetical protein